jgi:peptidoglycan/LPS O-acetylase OafA/YrhL
MPTKSTDGFRYDINALRAIAIIAVVAYHYGLKGFAGGFAGVDVFFVISGFLITSHISRDLARNRFSFLAFYVSRIRRIFPALAVMCFACAIWGWYFMLPRDYLANTRHELYALLFVSNYAFIDERGYFDVASSSKPLLHTWSLSVEGQFYLFLPLLLASIRRFAFKYSIIIILLIFLASLDWCLYFMLEARFTNYQHALGNF